MADNDPDDGKGFGVGEIVTDTAGEGDGCDRCGCPDEEVIDSMNGLHTNKNRSK
jgi:hypothetical protein